MNTPTTTIRLTEQEREQLARIQSRLYISTAAGGIRAAIKIASELLEQHQPVVPKQIAAHGGVKSRAHQH